MQVGFLHERCRHRPQALGCPINGIVSRGRIAPTTVERSGHNRGIYRVLRRRDTWRKVRRHRIKGVKQMAVRLEGMEEQQAALLATLAEMEASKGLLLRQVCSPIAGNTLLSQNTLPPPLFPVKETQMYTHMQDSEQSIVLAPVPIEVESIAWMQAASSGGLAY